jgi:hypothetical protein
MKKFFVICSFLLILGGGLLRAQNKALQFCYITKDFNTKVNPLVDELQDIYDFVRADSNFAAIFYLADWDTPIIVRVNLPGDNRDDMSKIFEALVTKSETSINPRSDLEKIPGLFEEIPLRGPAGSPSFSEVEFRFYVTPTFWELYYNEQVISSLWYVMELEQDWARGYVSLSVFHQEGDGLKPNAQAPFGLMDLCANNNFQLLTY